MTNAEFLEQYPEYSDVVEYYTKKLDKVINTWSSDSSTLYGIQKNVEAWYDNKTPLMDILRKHPYWNEEAKAVVLSTSQTRPSNTFDAGLEYRKLVTFVRKNLDVRLEWLEVSVDFSYKLQCNVDEDIIEMWKKFDPSIKMHNGQKTTRFINGLFKNVPLNTGEVVDATKLEDEENSYNRMFARLADYLSPLTIQRTTVLSTNPADYLLMSHGNSWSSCHNIDDGCYRAGCLSYMNDATSMIIYTLPSGECVEPSVQRKIDRQVFCYSEGMLLQSRLYPADDTQTSNELRQIVHRVLSESLDVPNLWDLKRERVGDYCRTRGNHYPDYNYRQATSTMSLHKELYSEEKKNVINIGSIAYCIDCGEDLDCEDSLSCCSNGTRCAECGNRYDRDDLRYINSEGEYYCDDCCFYCNYHEEYEVGESYIVNGDYVCEYIYNSEATQCEWCGENIWLDDCYITANETHYCERCAENHLVSCEECGDWIEGTDANAINDNWYCDYCANQNFVRCDECDDWIARGDEQDLEGRVLCNNCYEVSVEKTENVLEGVNA